MATLATLTTTTTLLWCPPVGLTLSTAILVAIDPFVSLALPAGEIDHHPIFPLELPFYAFPSLGNTTGTKSSFLHLLQVNFTIFQKWAKVRSV